MSTESHRMPFAAALPWMPRDAAGCTRRRWLLAAGALLAGGTGWAQERRVLTFGVVPYLSSRRLAELY